MPQPQPGDLVLCSRLGEEEFEILSQNNATREFRVRSTKTKVEQSIFKVHCHAPPALMFRNMKERKERKLARAHQVGNPTPKKK